MDIQENPYVKGVDVKKVLDEGFAAIGFERKPIREIIRDLAALRSKGIGYFRKVSKGMEMAYQRESNGFLVVAWTSFVWKESKFRIDDQIWVLTVDHRREDPFFSFPINRTGDFFSRLFNTARVYSARAEYWPTCSHCGEKGYWNTVQSDDFEVIDEEFHNREIVCKNKSCKQYMLPGKQIIDFPFPDPKDQKFFAAPFRRAQALRRKHRIEGKATIPRRLIRYWSKLGIKLPRKKHVYDDLAFEKSQKGKVHLYNEEAINELLYYDERQNEHRTHAE